MSIPPQNSCRDTRLFVGDVDCRLTCHIQSGVLPFRRGMALSSPCGHVFCASCITEWLKRKHECPVDRSPLTQDKLVQMPVSMSSMLCDLQSKCDWAAQGCEWTGKWETLADHQKTCAFSKPANCKWKKVGCTFCGPKPKVIQHEVGCEFRLTAIVKEVVEPQLAAMRSEHREEVASVRAEFTRKLQEIKSQLDVLRKEKETKEKDNGERLIILEEQLKRADTIMEDQKAQIESLKTQLQSTKSEQQSAGAGQSGGASAANNSGESKKKRKKKKKGKSKEVVEVELEAEAEAEAEKEEQDSVEGPKRLEWLDFRDKLIRMAIAQESGTKEKLPMEFCLESIENDPDFKLAYCVLAKLIEKDQTVKLYDGRELTQRQLYMTAMGTCTSCWNPFCASAPATNFGAPALYGLACTLKDDEKLNVSLREGEKPVDKGRLLLKAFTIDDCHSHTNSELARIFPSGVSKSGRVHSNRDLLLKAIHCDPTNASARYQLGMLMKPDEKVSIRAYEPAVDQRMLFLDTVRADPKLAQAYVRVEETVPQDMSVIMPNSEKWSKKELLLHAIRLDSSISDAYFRLALLLPTKEETIKLPDGKAVGRKELFVEAVRCTKNKVQEFHRIGNALLEGETVTLSDVEWTKEKLLEYKE